MKKKLTVAIMFSSLIDDYQGKIWQGALDEASKHNIQLVTLMGLNINNPRNYGEKETKIYSLCHSARFDGVIVPASAIMTNLNDHEKAVYFQHFINTPVISIGHSIDGIPSLLVDNYQGLFDIVEHLIKHHGYTQIGYIGGPENHDEAKVRYQAYVDALKKNDIEYRQEYVEYGNFVHESGAVAMQKFLDDKQVNLEAVVCANDNMAIGAIKELTRRKIPVPENIAVVGFDNVEDAIAIKPPLTTVSQPAEEIGKHAMSIMHKMLKNQSYKKEYVNATNVMIRQSCGCIMKDTSMTDSTDKKTGREAGAKTSEHVRKLYGALKKDTYKFTNDFFVAEFNELIQTTEDFFSLFPLLHTLRSMIKDEIEARDQHFVEIEKGGFFNKDTVKIDINKYYHAEHLLSLAGRLITENVEQKGIQAKLSSDREMMMLNQIGSNILSYATSNDSIFRRITEEFPVMGLADCLIVKADDDYQEATLEYSLDNRFTQLAGISYSYRDIFPDRLWDSLSDNSLLIFPIYLRNKTYGFAAYSVSVPGGHIYQILSRNIGNAIQSALDYEKQLKRSNNIQSLVWPMLNMIKEIAGSGNNQEDEMDDKSLDETIIGQTSLRIKEMLAFVNIINNISKGINLLAINSSIQASQAGKYAKTFKVVSEEIRRLSDTTAVNADKIEKVLKDISKLISSIIEKMTELSDNSNQILEYMSSSE